MGGSDDSPVSTANIWGVRSSKHSSMVSKPDLEPNRENHGVQMWAGIRNPSSDVSSRISSKCFASSPKIGRPSDLMLPIWSSRALNRVAVSMSGRNTRLWFLRVAPAFLYILLISQLKINRMGAGSANGSCFSHTDSSSSLSLNNPGSAGTSFSWISVIQAGWVKSPVPTTVIPLMRAAIYKFSKLRLLAVARENREWICRSAMNFIKWVPD